jgi:division protein CdvB (Snf7/Vps24/ESCRT-III family)
MGIMSEMMNEAVDAAMDNNDLEEETDEEIAKVLDEILAGKRKSTRKFQLICFSRQSRSITQCCHWRKRNPSSCCS